MSPTPQHRRVFAILSVLYGVLVLGCLPWATRAVSVTPNVVGIYGIGILFADLCTAAMLVRLFLSQRRPALLLLVCGYLFSAALVLAYTLSFNGAVLAGRLFGNEYTANALFLALRLGTALLFVTAVAVESYARGWRAKPYQLSLACVVTLLVCVALAVVLSGDYVKLPLTLPVSDAERIISWGTIGLYCVGAFLIWRKRAFNDALYLWLALILVASAADLILSTVAGARYTVGWYIAHCSAVVSSYLLLTFLLGELASVARSQSGMVVAIRYTAAIAIALAAVILRWTLLPWLKSDVLYATLFGAVAVAVWMGGAGPALMAAVVGLAGTTLLLGTPETFAVNEGWNTVLGLAVYVATCALIIGLGEALRKARDDYRRSQQMYKEVALELKERAAELQQANSVKSVFLATLSHELRNPLAPLRNGIAILKRRAPDGPGEVYAMMERQFGLLTRLIDDLLDVSRVDRGKLELHRENVTVESFVNAAIETARPNIEGKSHELVVHYAPRVFHVEGDPTRLAQVIANLLNNAAKYTPANGRIELSTRTEGPQVVIAVRDNGIGIPADELARIFDLFVQLDASRTREAAGLGLGLALARSLVALHGGDITVQSAGVGQGSEFQVHLPLASAPTTVAADPQGTTSSPSGRHLPVFDDSGASTASMGALWGDGGRSLH